ncbi:Heat shock protein 12A [Hypsizygus marmoreus]|uniref:Heat shock protein 12A n=1 Tax=Hypsizygus marmoreus TaxID=39966 RepID=A0A369JPE4_HYPMA|nr:Heat shock protein 12A [Hypsizygus marmoreus]
MERNRGCPLFLLAMPPTRPPYTGSSRKLVLAFDVGTTFSGISYSILDPGQVPEIKGVTRFPAQEKVGGDSKIPTIIYYDQDGKVRAVGAEATQESIKETIEDEGWTKAEWFKLHMRPKAIAGSSSLYKLPPLPRNKSVVDLFADFMRYLYGCAKTYIQETHANGPQLWLSVEPTIEFVLTHPNGWEGAQQQQMRKAAILAGLIPDNVAGHARVHLVTEGEASLHFCIQSGLTTDALKSGGGVLIVDAGGGTIDLSAYGQTSASNDSSFEEIASPECHLQGSAFVTSRAQQFLEDLLRDSKFFGDVETMKEHFDKSSKLTFEKIENPLFIKFGGVRDRDPKLNIRGGQLKLSGTDVATFFQPSVACIIEAVKKQCAAAQKPISVVDSNTVQSVFLVGGFSASEWLFSQLKISLEQLGKTICRPDSHVNKAVADGAASFYLDHSVAIRVSKLVYGTGCCTLFDPKDSEHRSRLSSVRTWADGYKRVSGAFSVILRKNVQVSETQEFRASFSRPVKDRLDLDEVFTSIECYRGTDVLPRWKDIDTDMYSTLCFISADTSNLSKTLSPRFARENGTLHTYFKIDFDIILLFGLTELKAQIGWIEDGVEKRSPARIVYDSDIARADT